MSELNFIREAYAALEAELLEVKAFYGKRFALRDDIFQSLCELQQHVFDSDAHMHTMWEKTEDKFLQWSSRLGDARKDLAVSLRLANDFQARTRIPSPEAQRCDSVCLTAHVAGKGNRLPPLSSRDSRGRTS